MWGPDSAPSWTFVLIWICLNCLSWWIKQNPQLNRCYGWSLLPHWVLSSIVRLPQMSLVLGVSVLSPLNLSWSINFIQPTTTMQIRFNISTSLIAIFSHSVSWDYSLDNHFRSSCLHRWVLSSPSAPSIVLLRCAEWWRPTLCGRWEITPHGRLLCLICVSHSLHAPPLCLPLIWWLCLCVHSPCAVPFSVDFVFMVLFICTHAVLLLFLKDALCSVQSFLLAITFELWYSCKPNKTWNCNFKIHLFVTCMLIQSVSLKQTAFSVALPKM